MKLFSWLTIIILLNVLFSWTTNLPQNVGEDVPTGKLKSLSYAPFREGQDPMLKIFPTEKQMDEDLALLGNVTYNIRTYASAEGNMSLLPKLAKKHDLTMLQGGWLGAYKADSAEKSAKLKAQNDLEMTALIRSANENPDVVKRVIVGNEVLLRGDLEIDELIAYIRKVKAAVKQPVSYADVWSEYMKHPQLIKEVDFITIHILPYWEDEPISVADAPAHVERIYKQVQQEAQKIAGDKPILIGESGWPSGGKQRGFSVPSVVNEARFIRDFIQIATKNNFDYNIVEAFNQPWKAAFEGVIGAKWGLYDSSREPVFALTGKVYENPNWVKLSAISTFLFLSVVVFRNLLTTLSQNRLVTFLATIQILAVSFVSQAQILWSTSYTDFQRLQTLLMLSFNVLFMTFVLMRIVAILTKKITPSLLSKRLYFSLLVVITYALCKTAILAWDGRYVDFPIAPLQTTVFSMIALASINHFIEKTPINVNALIGYVRHDDIKIICNSFIGLSVLLIIGESYAFMVSRDFIMAYPSMVSGLGTAILYTFSNMQLLIWLGILGVLAMPFYLSGKMPKSPL